MSLSPGKFRFASQLLFFARKSLGLCFTSLYRYSSRTRIKQLAYDWGYCWEQLEIPCIPLEELVDIKTETLLCRPEPKPWNVSLFELAAINSLVVKHAPGRAFEIGTFDGRTTLNLAANMPPGGRVFTLDLPPDARPNQPPAGKFFHGSKYEERIVQLFGDSVTYDFSPYDNGIDFVFVDAGHAYENVIRDSKAAFLMLGERPGAIVWHDYARIPDVTRALNEIRSQLPDKSRFYRIAKTSLVVFEQ